MSVSRIWRLRQSRYRLEGIRCQQCGKLAFPPRPSCPACRSSQVQPYSFKGRGTVYSFATVWQAPAAFAGQVPYLVALIDLEEGVRITAQLTDVEPDQVHIGMPVEMVIRRLKEEGPRGVIQYGYKFRPLLNQSSSPPREEESRPQESGKG